MTQQNSLIDPRIPFSLAGELWLKSQEAYVGPRTIKDRRKYVAFLCRFFANKRLDEITISDVFDYQAWRQKNIRRPEVCNRQYPGNDITNREIEVLRRILKAADLWAPIARHYKPLPETQSGPGQALTPEEGGRLFEIAATKPRWFVARCCVIISANTTAGPGEIRNLQLRDIDINGSVPHIVIRRGAKNRFRLRELELNDLALDAIKQLLTRARSKGCHLPEHYLLPHRERKLSAGPNPHFDPTRPQTEWKPRRSGDTFDPTHPQESWKRAWYALRAKFAEEFPERANLRLYDMRHTGTTIMLSDKDTPPQAVSEICGHSTGAMLARYSHQRKELRLAALQRLGKAYQPTESAPTGPAPSQAISTAHSYSGTLGFGLRSLDALRKVSS
jgi:integrase